MGIVAKGYISPYTNKKEYEKQKEIATISRLNYNPVKAAQLKEQQLKEQNKKANNNWFNTSAFDDGYQFGDITKTIFSTGADLSLDILQGGLNTIEGITDTGTYLLADIVDFFGADDFAHSMRKNADFNSFGAWFGTNEDANDTLFGHWQEGIEQNSLAGEKLDTIGQSLGQIGGYALTGGVLGGSVAANNMVIFSSAYGNAKSEAKRNGASEGDAIKSAFISATAETISENLFNGIPGLKSAGWFDNVTSKVVGKYFNGTTGKIAFKIIDSLSEGTEEVVSNVLELSETYLMDAIEKKLGNEKGYQYGMQNLSGNYIDDLKKTLTSQETWDAFLSAAISSAIVGAGTTTVQNTRMNNAIRDYATKNNVSIEQAKKDFQTVLDSAVAESKKIDSNLKDQYQLEENLKGQLSKSVKQGLNLSEVAQNVRTDEENQYHRFEFTAGETESYKDNDIAKNIIEKAQASNLNNTKKTHEIVKTAIKVAQELNTNVDFTNNQEIAQQLIKNKQQELGRELTQKEKAELEQYASQINGMKLGNNILLNTDSKQSAKYTLGHELKHFLEQNSKLNEELNEKLIEWAKLKGKYDTDFANMSTLYKQVQNANVIDELTANYTGEFFSSEANLKAFATENPGLFTKIANYFKKLYYKATNQQEKLLIQEINEKIQKVYSQVSKERANLPIDRTNKADMNGDTKYHISETLNKELDAVLSDINYRNPVRLRDFTPETLVNNGVKDLPMYENPAHIRKNILTESEAKQLGLKINKDDNYHGLGKDIYMKAVDSLDNPRVIFKNSNTGDYIVLTTIKDADNNTIIVPIEIETTTTSNNINIDINRVKSIYGYDRKTPDLNEYIKKNINSNVFTKIYEQKKNESTRKSSQSSSYVNNISQTKENVKSNVNLPLDIKFSLSQDNQEERISELNKRYEELDKVREITFDDRDSLRKELNDLIRSENYKNAETKFKEMIKSDMTPDEISKTPEYKIMEQEEKIRNRLKDYDDDVKYMTEEMSKIAEMIEKEEKEHRNLEKAIKEAKKIFGITRDYREAGYMLQDGSLLDFSGRNQGSNNYGSRGLDHRDINEIGYDMDEFIELGNIRMKPEAPGFEINIEPTSKQYSALYDYIEYIKEKEGMYPPENSYINVDIEKKGTARYDTASYKVKTPTRKIINDIKEYYKTGEFPKQSDFMEYYSMGQQNTTLQDVDKTSLSDLKVKDKNAKEINLPTVEKMNKVTPKVRTPKEEAEKRVRDKVKKAIENQSYKAVNIATKTGQNYLDFDRQQKAEFKEKLSKYIGKNQQQLTNAKTWNDIKDLVYSYANREMTYVDEELKRVKDDIRNKNIKITDDLKQQITDYGDFRRSNFGKLKLGEKGTSVDSIYQELSSQYPYYFGEATTEADMLYELSDFMNQDVNMTQKYQLDEETLDEATTKVYNSLMRNAMTKDSIEELQAKLEAKMNARTREVIQGELLEDMGITLEDIAKGKDVSALETVRTDPIRLNEKVFGYEVGNKINDATIRRTKHNEAERTRWLNQERQDIKDLGIKARSKESAAVQKYGEKQYVNDNGEVIKYGDAELAREFSDIATQEKIKHAAQVIRNKYDEYIDQINNSLVNMGYKPIQKRNDYMRHFQALNDVFSRFGTPLNKESMQSDSLPTDINGLTDQFKPGKEYFASAMKRLGMKTEYDAITGIDGYLNGASDLIYHTEDIQRYRTLAKLIRNTYGQTHGYEDFATMTPEQQVQRIEDIQSNKLAKYAAWLDEQANTLANKKGAVDRSAERIFGRKVYNLLNTAKKQVGSNMTGYNVRSAMTNFASVVQGASKTNKLAFLKGTISTINNIIHDDGLADKSDFLTSRLKGSESLSPKLWQKLANKGQIFMQGTDWFTANQIWRSKYFENLQNGMNENQAIKNADDFASRIMGDRSKGATAELFNSKTLGFFTQFQLEVNNQWSSLIHDNKVDIQNGSKSVASMLFQTGQLFGLAYLFNGMMKSLTGSKVMIDPIELFKKIFAPDDDEKTTEERAREALGDVVDDLPFVSFFTGGGRIPVKEAFKGLGTAVDYATGKTNSYGQPITLEDVKNDVIESAAYWLLPTGYSQIRKTTKGLGMYDENLPIAGSYTKSGRLRFEADTSTGGKIRSALFGEYASKEAREYLDKGYAPLTEKQIQEIKDYDMSVKQYREFSEDLKEAQRTKVETDDGTYEMYTDDKDNWYWYNTDTGKVYSTTKSIFDINDLKKTNINPTTLHKTTKSESTYDYIMNTNLPTADKVKILNNELNKEDTITDKYGYIKYKDKDGKTYWYDKNNKIVYDNKYTATNKNILTLTQASNEYTQKDLTDYGTYEEMNYAINNPEKYAAIKQITNYETYNSYTDEIQKIKAKYASTDNMTSKQKTAMSKKRKEEVQKYINSLKLNKYQKMMLEKLAGGYSIKSHEKEMFKYINSLQMTKKEKETLHKELFG